MVTSKQLKDKFCVLADGGAQHSVILTWDGSQKRKTHDAYDEIAAEQPVTKRYSFLLYSRIKKVFSVFTFQRPSDVNSKSSKI